jgi:hypothetical protein
LRDSAAGFLCVSPRGGDRAVGQPVPAGQGRTSAHPPQSDGDVRAAACRSLSTSAAQRVPRQIPDEVFNELFARLCSDRDRALVAFRVSTAARARSGSPSAPGWPRHLPRFRPGSTCATPATWWCGRDGHLDRHADPAAGGGRRSRRAEHRGAGHPRTRARPRGVQGVGHVAPADASPR